MKERPQVHYQCSSLAVSEFSNSMYAYYYIDMESTLSQYNTILCKLRKPTGDRAIG